MDTEKVAERKAVPPYIAYKTFKNYIERWRVAMPQQIDRSVLSSLSGAQQGQLLGALVYLGLLTDRGVPTEKLIRLAGSEGAEWHKNLKTILTTSFPFLFKEGFDLSRVSPRQLEDEFESAASGDTVRKCVGFFVNAAKDAGIQISPFIKTGRRPRSSGSRSRRTVNNAGETNNPAHGWDSSSLPDPMGWQQLLLAKFPSFDPNWDSEVQAKWFDAFAKLMRKTDEGEA